MTMNYMILSIFMVLLNNSGGVSLTHNQLSFKESVMLSAGGRVTSSIVTASLPHFAESIRNVTVPLGRETKLSCVINNLAEYKVGWLRADDQTILSLHRRIVTHNPRISVTHDESRTWNLHIRQIKESDQGCYMCQINTATMKKQLGCIQVQVPPDIIDDLSTSDVTVNEGDNVTLTCEATGKPAPRIVWRREDGQKIVVFRASTSTANPNNIHERKTFSSRSTVSNATIISAMVDSVSSHHHQGSAATMTRERSKEVEAYYGETLRLNRVTRQMMAAYMCIAANDVPPAVSKRVHLNVNFSPLVTSSMNVVGAFLGSDVRLTCNVESHPPSINYWMKGRQQDQHNTILSSAKYSIDGQRGGSTSYKTSMSLTIHNFEPQDKSAYVCMAANSLGTAEASIQIYEVARVTTPASGHKIVTASNREDLVIEIDNDENEGENEENRKEKSGGGFHSTKNRPTKEKSQNINTDKTHSRHHPKHATETLSSSSQQQQERIQEQRDHQADNKTRDRGVPSGSSLKKPQSFIYNWIVIVPFTLTTMISSHKKLI